MEFAFHVFNSLALPGMTVALKKLLGPVTASPVVLCVGSDLAVGDSLGPVTGTLIRRHAAGFGGYIYGTLRTPVTAKEVKYVGEFIRETHPGSKIIAVDAAVGDESEIGLIKATDAALRPGLGVNKCLCKIGDVSVLGIIARKSSFSYSLLNLTRLNTVYSMAETIARSISSLMEEHSALRTDRFSQHKL